jgi:hypothetical protein
VLANSFLPYSYIETRKSTSRNLSCSLVSFPNRFSIAVMTSDGAHLGLQLPSSNLSAGNQAAANSPLSPPSTQQPAVTRQSAPASAPVQPNPMQIQPPAQQRQAPVVATSASTDRDEVIRHQGDKIARLQAQLSQLSAVHSSVPHTEWPGVDPVQAVANNAPADMEVHAQQATPQRTLFMDEMEAEQVQAQLLAKATEDSSSRKAALLDIVPGFKASPLSLSKCILSIPSLPFDQYLLPMEHIRTILVLSVSFLAEQWAYIYIFLQAGGSSFFLLVGAVGSFAIGLEARFFVGA